MALTRHRQRLLLKGDVVPCQARGSDSAMLDWESAKDSYGRRFGQLYESDAVSAMDGDLSEAALASLEDSRPRGLRSRPRASPC